MEERRRRKHLNCQILPAALRASAAVPCKRLVMLNRYPQPRLACRSLSALTVRGWPRAWRLRALAPVGAPARAAWGGEPGPTGSRGAREGRGNMAEPEQETRHRPLAHSPCAVGQLQPAGQGLGGLRPFGGAAPPLFF